MKRICSKSGNALWLRPLPIPSQALTKGRCRDWTGSTLWFLPMVKGQSRPQTVGNFLTGDESRSGMNPGVVGSNPTADTIVFFSKRKRLFQPLINLLNCELRGFYIREFCFLSRRWSIRKMIRSSFYPRPLLMPIWKNGVAILQQACSLLHLQD